MAGNATPATVLLAATRIEHRVHSYSHDPRAAAFGAEAAQILGERLGVDSAQVFKTLVVRTVEGGLAVAVVPVSAKLSMKAAAAALSTRKVVMAQQAEAERSTGYVFGGISPLGQRKTLPTVLDASAMQWDAIFFSGGRRGLEIELNPNDLVRLTAARVVSVAVV